jgi:hypothetical protein
MYPTVEETTTTNNDDDDNSKTRRQDFDNFKKWPKVVKHHPRVNFEPSGRQGEKEVNEE